VKIKEVRDKSKDELDQELRELNAELFNLRSKKVTSQLDKPHKFKEIKKTIARIKTVLKERG
jgi:large subunit ribosomal protein L29